MKRILIVEDVELNRDLLIQLLEEDYALVIATDGAAGVAKAADKRPDLILMDLRCRTLTAGRRLNGSRPTRSPRASPPSPSRRMP